MQWAFCSMAGHTPKSGLLIQAFNFMDGVLEKIFSKAWNWLFSKKPKALLAGLLLGYLILDDRPTKYKVFLGHEQRARHTLILGRNGTGKSSLIDFEIEQDIKAGRGFLAIKFHDDHKLFFLPLLNRKRGPAKT